MPTGCRSSFGTAAKALSSGHCCTQKKDLNLIPLPAHKCTPHKFTSPSSFSAPFLESSKNNWFTIPSFPYYISVRQGAKTRRWGFLRWGYLFPIFDGPKPNTSIKPQPYHCIALRVPPPQGEWVSEWLVFFESDWLFLGPPPPGEVCKNPGA